MRLFATLVPPADVVAELRRAIASLELSTPGPGKRRLLRRPEPPTVVGLADQLDLLPSALVQTPLAIFGNLTLHDARRLTDLVTEEAAGWPAPRLRLAGGQALVWPGDTWVWSGIEGDVAAMHTIAGGVSQVAGRLSMYVDRRRFHPLVPVGQVNDATTDAYLEALVAALERFSGTPWVQQELTVFQGAPPDSSQGSPLTPFAQVRLGR